MTFYIKKNYKFSKTLNTLENQQTLSWADNEKGQRECPAMPGVVKI